MENNDISLNLSRDADVLQSLFLFQSLRCGEHSSVELSESSQGYRLNAEEVKAEAEEVLRQVRTDGEAFGKSKVMPILFIGTGGFGSIQSRVFWQCLWVDGNGEPETVWVDDLSGQVVGFVLNDPSYSFDAAYSKEYIPEAAYRLEEFCRRYYPAEEVFLQYEGKNASTLILTQMQDGAESSCPVFVRWEGGTALF